MPHSSVGRPRSALVFCFGRRFQLQPYMLGAPPSGWCAWRVCVRLLPLSFTHVCVRFIFVEKFRTNKMKKNVIRSSTLVLVFCLPALLAGCGAHRHLHTDTDIEQRESVAEKVDISRDSASMRKPVFLGKPNFFKILVAAIGSVGATILPNIRASVKLKESPSRQEAP